MTLLRSNLPEHSLGKLFFLGHLDFGVHVDGIIPNRRRLCDTVDCGMASSIFPEEREGAFFRAGNLGTASRDNCSLNTPCLEYYWESEMNF